MECFSRDQLSLNTPFKNLVDVIGLVVEVAETIVQVNHFPLNGFQEEGTEYRGDGMTVQPLG